MKKSLFLAMLIICHFNGIVAQSLSSDHKFCCGDDCKPDTLINIFKTDIKQALTYDQYPSIQHLRDAYFSPLVIGNNESFNFNMVVNTSNISEITIFTDLFYYNNQSVTNLILKDDGTQGDLVPNDSVFTINNLSLPSTYFAEFIGGFSISNSDIEFLFSNGTSETVSGYLNCIGGIINRDSVEIPVVDTLPTLFVNGYVFEMEHTSHVFNVVTEIPNLSLTGVYYMRFPDDRDVIIQGNTFPTPYGSPVGTYGIVKMMETGTHYGDYLFDNSSQYMSNGVLMGVMHTYYNNLQSYLINHELLHQFAVYTGPLGLGYSHWDLVKFPSSGFASGTQRTTFQQINDSIWHVWNENYTIKYNSFELYLMGLTPIDSVVFPIEALINPVHLGYSNGHAVYRADGLLSVDSNYFYSYMSHRSPAFPVAPNNFKMALCITSRRLLNPTEMAYYNYLMIDNESTSPSPIGMNFHTATEGKGTLETVLPSPSYLTADFIADHTSGNAPLEVQFTDISNPGTFPIVSWFWDFGDGNTSTEQNPTNIYTTQGSFNVTLITNTEWTSDTIVKTNFIEILAVCPTANFTANPSTGYIPLNVQFTDLSSPGTYPISSWSWDFGDGNTSSEQNPIHEYSSTGSYDISLIVTSDTLSSSITMPSMINLFLPLNIDAGPDQINTIGNSVYVEGIVSGGSGEYTYHWEPHSLLIHPDSIGTFSLPLYSDTLFFLTVSDFLVGHTELDSLKITTLVGINEIDETSRLIVYPNPFNNKLNILFEPQFSSCLSYNISLYDSNGKLVLSRKDISLSTILVIEGLERLPTGKYSLNIFNNCSKKQIDLIHLKN